jgi:Fe-S-cluster-containing hydrogenase component 2
MSLLANWLESLSYELKATNHCLRKVSPFSSCTVCKDTCPEEAITLVTSDLEINHQLCNNCGTCLTNCPVQALEGQSPIRKVLEDVIFLDEGPLPTENELLYFYKKGIRKVSQTQLDEKLKQIIEKTNDRLVKMDLTPITLGHFFETKATSSPAQKLSRRDFFSKLSFDSKKLVLSSVTPVTWRFNQGKFNRAEMFEGWASFAIHLDKESCTLCETCFHLCPAEVFQFDGNLLTIDNGKCVGCSLCSDVCHYDSIKIDQEVGKTKIYIYPIVKRKCKSCGGDFTSWEYVQYCFTCESSKENSILNFL